MIIEPTGKSDDPGRRIQHIEHAHRRYRFPRVLDHPRAMPEFRAALVGLTEGDNIAGFASHGDGHEHDYALSGGLIAGIEYEKLLHDLAHRTPGFWRGDEGFMIGQDVSREDQVAIMVKIESATQQAQHYANWYRTNLGAAQLIHVDETMVDLVTDFAAAAPADLVLHEYDLPTPAGLVVFAKPVYGTDAGPEHPGESVRVDAVLWGPVKLPARDVTWDDPRTTDLRLKGVSIASFRLIAPGDTDHLGEMFNFSEEFWMPLGRSDWLFDDRLDRPAADHFPNQGPSQEDFKEAFADGLTNPIGSQMIIKSTLFASHMEDRRLLAALWATLNQRRLVDLIDVPPDKYVRKRLARAGQPQRHDTVRLVHLRRSEFKHLRETDSGTGHKLSVRFPVRSHYRRQPYGPGRQLRKLIIVPAHWKGPDDAPISKVEKVWELDR